MASTEAHRTERTDDVNLKRRRAQAEPIPASAVSNDGSPSALLVAEGVRKIYRTGEGKVVAHVGVNLADAMVFCLGTFPCSASRSG
jgi:hypothetical protein